MGTRTKPKALGTGSAIIGTIWTSYSALTTAKDIPEDAGWVAKMLAEPPIYLPWLLAALGVALVIWTFWWPSKLDDSDDGGLSQTTSGPQSPNVKGGGNTFNYYNGALPLEQTEQKKPKATIFDGDNLERLARALGTSSQPKRSVAADGHMPVAKRVPEFPIWGAIAHIASIIGDTDAHGCYPESRRRFRQAAHDGQFDVWGKKGMTPSHFGAPKACSEIWTPIDTSYWQDWKLNSHATGEMWDSYDHTEAEPHIRTGLLDGQYWSLRVDEADFKRAWPDRPLVDVQQSKPLPDLPLAGVLVRVAKRLPRPVDEAGKAAFHTKISLAIADAVVTHQLSTWGRHKDRPIHQIAWRDWRMASFNHRDKGSLSIPTDRPVPMVYKDIHFNKEEIDEIWPIPPKTSTSTHS